MYWVCWFGVSQTPVTAWGDVLADLGWCPTRLAGCREGGQGQGLDQSSLSPLALAPLLPSRRFPGELIATSDSFSHFPSPGSRQSLPGQARPGRPGREFAHLDTRENPKRGGTVGGAQPRHPTAAPRAQFLGDPSPLVTPSIVGGPSPVGGPRERSPRPATRPPSAPRCGRTFPRV